MILREAFIEWVNVCPLCNNFLVEKVRSGAYNLETKEKENFHMRANYMCGPAYASFGFTLD